MQPKFALYSKRIQGFLLTVLPAGYALFGLEYDPETSTAIQGLFTNLDTAFASVMSGAGILWQLYGMWTAKQPLTMDSSKAVTLKSVALPLFAVMVLAAAAQPAYAQLGGDYCITPGACQACPDTCPPVDPGECPPTAVELPLVEYEGSHFFLVPEDRRAFTTVGALIDAVQDLDRPLTVTYPTGQQWTRHNRETTRWDWPDGDTWADELRGLSDVPTYSLAQVSARYGGGPGDGIGTVRAAD